MSKLVRVVSWHTGLGYWFSLCVAQMSLVYITVNILC